MLALRQYEAENETMQQPASKRINVDTTQFFEI